MSDPYFQSMFAERIGGANYGKGTAIYKFEKIKRAKRKALADHPGRQLLDFGIGENDAMADEKVRRAMAEEISRPENRGYADNGVAAFKEAAARLMQREFGVSLDPVTEVNHCIGSKTALSMLPACFINPGDVTLMTVPGYPVAGTHTAYYGGIVYKLPLLAENDFFPDLDAIPADIADKAKLLVLCYPNSPTGKTASPEFYERAIAFAKKNDVVIIQDAAHGMLSYDRPPHSFLAIPGARDVGVEIHSLSKGYDMIGWRIGWVCGHPQIVRVCRREGQLRLGAVHRDSEGGGGRARRPGDTTPHPDEVQAAPREACRHAHPLWLQMPDAGRHVFSLYAVAAQLRGRRPRRQPRDVRKRRGGEPISDHRAIDLHGALG